MTDMIFFSICFAGVLVAVISLLCLWIADIWAERVTEIEI